MSTIDDPERVAAFMQMLRAQPFPDCSECGRDMQPLGVGRPREGGYCHSCGSCVCRKCLEAPLRENMVCPKCGSNCFDRTSETAPFIVKNELPL